LFHIFSAQIVCLLSPLCYLSPTTKYAYYALECIEALEWNSKGGSGGGGGGGGMRTVVGNINANVNTDINSSQTTTTATSGSSNDGDNDNNKRDNKINLIGHSMGAGVSVVLVAAFPELFESVTLLEGAGPLARNANDCARHVRVACQRLIKLSFRMELVARMEMVQITHH
jgi:hypothetical protein